MSNLTPSPKCILLDVEGTTSSISFVYDVMFPYVRENLAPFLANNWNSDSVQGCLPLLANDIGKDSVDEWLDADGPTAQQQVATAVTKLMDDDVKATGLKQLQGMIWKDGFESGQMTAHLFDDVADCMRKWHADGIEIRIYSSGSIAAQKLFFGHCVAGNLLPLIAGHYDTTIGSKKESASYVAIADDIGLPPSEIIFISDVPAELDAARSAGMQVILSIRPGNKPVENIDADSAIRDFSEVEAMCSLGPSKLI